MSFIATYCNACDVYLWLLCFSEVLRIGKHTCILYCLNLGRHNLLRPGCDADVKDLLCREGSDLLLHTLRCPRNGEKVEGVFLFAIVF